MNKKLLIATLFSTLSFGQIGINTNTPNSTLEVNGSYSGNFKETAVSKTLDINDQLINLTGSSDITITLPDGSGSNLIKGRIYTIKNSSSKNASIVGFNNNQLLRIDSNNTVQNFTLNAGSSIQIVKNSSTTNGQAFWEIIQFTTNIINNINGSKSIQYVRSISTPINSSTPTSSVVQIGNIRVRYNGTSPTTQGFIEYQVLTPTQITNWYRKAGSGGTGLDKWGTQNAVLNNWYKMAYQTSDNGNNITASNRDVSESIIILHQTKEVYRVTSNLNGDIAASGTIPAVASSATLFVERLE